MLFSDNPNISESEQATAPISSDYQVSAVSLLNSPKYIFCGLDTSIMDWDHVLKCSALGEIRTQSKGIGNLYWNARRRIAFMLSASAL